MKLTQNPNLRAEDFPKFESAEDLFKILNPFFVDINNVLDQNIDFSENIKSLTKNFVSKGVSLPIKFTWSYPKVTPNSVSIIKAKVDNSPACFVCSWDFDASNSNIVIYEIFQLSGTSIVPISNSSIYNLTIRVTV